MKFAILSDVHTNFEALKAVLADAENQGCSRHVFLGDFVGYGPDPKACVDIVRALNAPCVRGNLDDYCTSDHDLTDFNPNAAKHMRWTRERLTVDDLQWLNNLPYVIKVENFTMVHATLDHPERWGYVLDKFSAAESMAHQITPVCFFGHTHIPIAFVRDTTTRGGIYTKFRLESDKQYLVNPGSAGQPRDNNSAAAYAVYDPGESIIELHRVTYDIDTTRRKIRDAGLI